MTESRIVVSASAARRLQVAREWLVGEATVGERVVLSPTRGAADDLLRRTQAGVGLFGTHRATLGQLAHELAASSLARRQEAPVSGLGLEALVTRSIHGARAAGEIEYFEPVSQLPGFPRALASTLRELRLQGTPVETLAQAGAGGGDLARLLSRYEEELGRWSVVDPAHVLEAARQVAEASHRMVGLAYLLLDLSPRSRAEASFLAAVLQRSPSVLVTLPAGDSDGQRVLEEILETPAENLDEDEDESRGDGPPAGSRLHRLHRFVFQPEVPLPPARIGEDRSVEFFSAPGEGRESMEIARRIRDQCREGVAFDEQAILLRDPQSYMPLVEDALRRASIPVYFTRGTVRPDPAGRAFLALLACAAEDLSASRFAEYLSLGQVPRLDEWGAPPRIEVPWVEQKGDQMVLKTPAELPPAAGKREPAMESAETEEEAVLAGTLRVPLQWESLLVDASVVGGRRRWARRLEGLQKEIALQIREVGDEEEGRRQHLERQLDRLENLLRFALPVIDTLADLPASASWGEWLGLLEELAGMVLRRPESVLSLLAELRPMADVGPVDLDQVRGVLSERLSFLQTEPPDRRYGRVLVATIAEALGRELDTVYLPGLAEGIFPRKTSEDPLLLDQERRQIDSRLPVQENRVRGERLLLRIAAGAARRRLVVSYPRIDAHQGRSRVPSFYALDVLRAAEGRLPELKTLEKRAAEASASRLGWPAPSQTEDAIDNTEYDLALLDPLLHQSSPDKQGAGRFLLLCNTRLARSLRTRWGRWHKGWSSADGIVDPDLATLAILERHISRNRSYSPTALQTYAACPYRFLLYAIHRLRPRDELVTLEQLDPLTRGSLFHETQFALFGRLQELGLLPMSKGDLPRLLDQADGVLDDTARRYEEELAPAISRVFWDEIESLRSDLRGWIHHVVESAQGWKPIHFEFSFGLPLGPERDRASVKDVAVVLDGVKLRGAIDLVEESSDGKRLRVTDHKTGRAMAGGETIIGGGKVLQPLLYALAAQQLVAGAERVVEAGRLFYCTQRGGYQSVEVPLSLENQGVVEDVVHTIDRSLSKGFLPAAPGSGECTWCDFKLICGPLEEIRVQRKKRPRLRELSELRDRR